LDTYVKQSVDVGDRISWRQTDHEIRTLFEYDAWAFERIRESISQLSEEQFVAQIDYSTGSIRNIVVHMMSANRNWIGRIRGTEIPPRLVFEDFDTLSKTKTKWDELQREYFDCIYTT
jgi:uncharacterized damage-inducible protein DinB